jgi:hypothetical protein
MVGGGACYLSTWHQERCAVVLSFVRRRGTRGCHSGGTTDGSVRLGPKGTHAWWVWWWWCCCCRCSLFTFVFAGHQDGACSWLKRPKVHDIPGHNSPLVALGIFILWYTC